MQPVTRTRTCIKLMYFIARRTPATLCHRQHPSFASLLLHMNWHALKWRLRNSCRGTMVFFYVYWRTRLLRWHYCHTLNAISLCNMPEFMCSLLVDRGKISSETIECVCSVRTQIALETVQNIELTVALSLLNLCLRSASRIDYRLERWNCVDGRCSVYRHYVQQNGCLLCFAHGFIQLLSVAIKSSVRMLGLDIHYNAPHSMFVVWCSHRSKIYIK